jgi:hypothetical protein
MLSADEDGSPVGDSLKAKDTASVAKMSMK